MEKVIFIDGDSKRVAIQGKNFETHNQLPVGYYRASKKSSMMGMSISLQVTEPPMLPASAHSVANRIFDYGEVLKFFSKKNRYVHKQLNLKHKMAIMLYGIQGTGKTTTCLAFSNRLVEELEARVFYVNDYGCYAYTMEFIREARNLGQEFFSVIVFDECESALDDYENRMKTYLDGEKSIDNVLTLFCTNYIEDIPASIKDRPSRIKHCKEVVCLEAAEDIYVVAKEINEGVTDELKLSEETLNTLVTSIVTKECVTLDIIKNNVIDTIVESYNQ